MPPHRCAHLWCFLGVVCAALPASFAQATWQWTAQRGTVDRDFASSIATNDEGDLFVAGTTGGSLDGASSGGYEDVFLMKFSASGHWQWTVQHGSKYQDYGLSLDVRPDGNALVTGTSGGDFRTHGGSPYGPAGLLLMLVSSQGVLRWVDRPAALSALAPSDDPKSTGSGVVVRGDNGAVVAGAMGYGNAGWRLAVFLFSPGGSLEKTVQHTELGRSDAGAVVLAGQDILIAGRAEDVSGNYHIVVARYSSSGALLWMAQRGSGSGESAKAIMFDADDDIIVAGETHGRLDGNELAGGSDMFLMSFTANGHWQWTAQRGTPADDGARALAMAGEGVLVAGYTKGNLDANTHAGGSDIFLMEFSAAGMWRWTVQHGSSSDEVGQGLVVRDSAAIVAGLTKGNMDGHSNAGDADVILVSFSLTTSTSTTTTPCAECCVPPAYGRNVDSSSCEGKLPGEDCLVGCAQPYTGEAVRATCPLNGSLVFSGPEPTCSLSTAPGCTTSEFKSHAWADVRLMADADLHLCGRLPRDVDRGFCSAFASFHVLNETECPPSGPCRQAHSIRAVSDQLYRLSAADLVVEVIAVPLVGLLLLLALSTHSRRVHTAESSTKEVGHGSRTKCVGQSIVVIHLALFIADATLQVLSIAVAFSGAVEEIENLQTAHCTNNAGMLTIAELGEALKALQWLGCFELGLSTLGAFLDCLVLRKVLRGELEKAEVLLESLISVMCAAMAVVDFAVFSAKLSRDTHELLEAVEPGGPVQGIQWCLDMLQRCPPGLPNA